MFGKDHKAENGIHRHKKMERVKNASLRFSLSLLALSFGPSIGSSFAMDNKNFSMVPTSPSTCLPGAKGRVTVSTPFNQNLHVEVSGLPANTEFDFFIIQQPTSPFGMSWYQGDIKTDFNGPGVGDFVGRFSIETFTVAPGAAQARVFHTDASSNPATAPIQMYHLGLWFNSPQDAQYAGCLNSVTPFNGEHNAGVQVLNTSNFPNLNGPLRSIQ